MFNKLRSISFAATCATLLFAAPAARAEGTPIQGTDVGLEHDPQGIVANGVTDNGGQVTFRDLKPGKYVLTVPPSIVPADANRPKNFRVTLTVQPTGSATKAAPLSFEACACGGAKEGPHIGFAIPDAGGSVTLQLGIFDQASSGSLTSY